MKTNSKEVSLDVGVGASNVLALQRAPKVLHWPSLAKRVTDPFLAPQATSL